MSVTKWFHSASGRDALFAMENMCASSGDDFKIDGDELRIIALDDIFPAPAFYFHLRSRDQIYPAHGTRELSSMKSFCYFKHRLKST